MRKSLFTAVAFLAAIAGFSQVVNSQVNNPGSGTPMFVYDFQGRPMHEKMVEDAEGSPWLLDEWSTGLVKLRNGNFAKDILLRFDLLNNRLFFQRDNTSFEFVMPVKEFSIASAVYRSGFAAVDRNSEETFYEVLADGKLQLLNYRHKLINEYKPYNQPLRKKFMEREQLYIALPGNKIVKIKKDKDDILAALPEYSTAINKIVAEKGLKLKKQDDIAQLITALNKQ